MNPPENRWNPAARPAELQPAAAQSDSEAQVAAHLGQSEPVDRAAGDEAPRDITAPTSARLRQVQGVELQAILGADTALVGSFSFAGKVRIDGRVEGTVHGGEVLIVGEGARVSGSLAARRVIVLGGHIDADITAAESIELYIPAVVRGDLKSPQVYMDRGIQFQGTCDMTLDPPAVELEPEGGGSS